ncbi:MAG: TonB-dependent receptor [Ignavibacteriales bacterium]|nr:TonB-dependent receptor [Ignavibacteriales bacterium]
MQHINKLLVLIFTIFYLMAASFLFAQTGSISGSVSNRDNEKGIAGANIFIEEINTGTSTDDSGEFRFNQVPKGNYTLIFSFVGFKTERTKIKITGDSSLTIKINLQPSSVFLGEVTVSSSRHEKMFRDVPIPMELETSEQIKKIPALTVSDALKNLPGVSLSRDGIWGTYVSIRGFNRASIVTLVDGNRIETATDIAAGLSMIDLSDVDRIEVIKGAASSLYGTGAVGGVVNIFTKSAYFSNAYYNNGKLTSSYNSVNNQPAFNLSLNSGGNKWYTHLSGMIRKAENTRTPVGTLMNSQFEDNNISVSVGVMPFIDHEFKVSFQQFNAENVGIPGASSSFPSIADVRYPKEMRRMISAEYKINNLSESFHNLSFKVFNQLIQRDVENIPHTVQNVPAQAGQPPKRVSVLKITPNADHDTYGFQSQSDWTFSKIHYLIAGIDGWQRSYKGNREKSQKIEVLNPTDQSVVSETNKIIGEKPVPDSKFFSLGVYAQDDIKLIEDKLSMTVGGRVDRINISNEKTYNPVYEITNGVWNDAPSSQILYWDKKNVNDISYSGNINFLYKAFNDIDFTFSSAHSFRSPSLEERYQYIDQGSVIRLGDPNLKPEKGWFFDLGMRVWKTDFNFTGDIFWNSLTDLVVEMPGSYEGRKALIKTNIGKAQLYGFDLGLQYNFLTSFVGYATAAYVNGKDVFNHTYLPQISPLNGKAGIKTSEAKYFDVDLSATLFGKQNKVAVGELATPGYVYFDLYLSSIQFDLGLIKYQIFAGVENLTDKAYRNHLSTNRGLITIEPGRNIFARLSINW